ncbi:hypothetical protein KQX64_06825 [Rhodopseudomonas palustris]|nr:hypothetical protein KQX64_06825 [Rhodopseudomonas palustris]
MADFPILYTSAMVRALLAGWKTQTRRPAWRNNTRKVGVFTDPKDREAKPSPWQKVKPGDRLWVRETWQYAPQRYCCCPQGAEPSPCDDWLDGTGCQSSRDGVVYAADRTTAASWRPSIHLPRFASRLTLIVTATKTERLQVISAEDAVAEGLIPIGVRFGIPVFKIEGDDRHGTAVSAFAELWRGSYSSGPNAWERNPEVVAISFRVVRANIDSAEALAA